MDLINVYMVKAGTYVFQSTEEFEFVLLTNTAAHETLKIHLGQRNLAALVIISERLHLVLNGFVA